MNISNFWGPKPVSSGQNWTVCFAGLPFTFCSVCVISQYFLFQNVSEISVDDKNRIVSTPAFMYNGKFHEINDGIGLMIKKLLSLIQK